MVRFGTPGAADLTGILSDGTRLEVEVKTPRGRQSAQQKLYQSMIERFGGIYIVARDPEEAEAILEIAIKQKDKNKKL